MCATRVQVAIVAIIVAATTVADANNPAEPLDEGTATLWSAVGTAAPLLTLGASIGFIASSGDLDTPPAAVAIASAAGLYVLPSAGHWYSGKRFTTGFAIRTVGMVFAGLGLVKVIKGAGCHCFCDDSANDYPLFVVGGAFVLGGAVHDIVTAASRARSVNARMRPTITPVPMPGGGGGVSVSLRF